MPAYINVGQWGGGGTVASKARRCWLVGFLQPVDLPNGGGLSHLLYKRRPLARFHSAYSLAAAASQQVGPGVTQGDGASRSSACSQWQPAPTPDAGCSSS